MEQDYKHLIGELIPGNSWQEKYECLQMIIKERNEHLSKRKRKKFPVTKKITFEESEIFDKKAFKAKFSDWSTDKLRHYHGAAIAYSGEGNKYVNWDRAIHNWASADDARDKFKWKPDGPATTSQPLNGLVI